MITAEEYAQREMFAGEFLSNFTQVLQTSKQDNLTREVTHGNLDNLFTFFAIENNVRIVDQILRFSIGRRFFKIYPKINFSKRKCIIVYKTFELVRCVGEGAISRNAISDLDILFNLHSEDQYLVSMMNAEERIPASFKTSIFYEYCNRLISYIETDPLV